MPKKSLLAIRKAKDVKIVCTLVKEVKCLKRSSIIPEERKANIMLAHIVGVVVLALAVIHVYRFVRILDYEKHDIIYKHYPGPCIQLDGADGGSEDITTLPDGLTFISSGFFPDTKPRILLFDFKDSKHEVTELQIKGNVPGFRPHGLSVWEEPKSGILTLMVVSHGQNESVEMFEFTRGTTVLKHVKSVQTGGKSMNDIVALSKDTFYGTQSGEYTMGTIMFYIELYLILDLGKVWYYNGNSLELVASGLGGPNGINMSPDLRYIYVAELKSKSILTYEKEENGKLNLIQKRFIDTNPDNIEIDPKTGALWIGCHPRGFAIFEYCFKYAGKSISPSQILRINTDDGIPTADIAEVFLDDGKSCSASTVASFFKRRMLVGTLASQLVLCDVLSTTETLS